MRRIVASIFITAAALSTGGMTARASDGTSPRLRAPLDPRAILALATARESRLVGAFVRTGDPPETRRAIVDAGGRVGVAVGSVLAAELPLGAMAGLAGRSEVRFIELSPPVDALLDEASRETQANRIHLGTAPLRSPYTGRGVLVGVVDVGLDLAHGAFRGEDGRSRVVALWDQTVDGQPPEGFEYGTACDATTLRDDECEHRPDGYHGTHIAGVAAGSSVVGAPFVGVAFDSDLAFVNLRTSRELLGPAICDAVAFIFGIARARSQPAVINLSIGDMLGPHDGSTLAHACLNELVGPGRLLVAAAGNDGRGNVHPISSERVFAHAAGEATSDPVLVPMRASYDGVSVRAAGSIVWDEDASIVVRIGGEDESGAIFYSSPVILGESAVVETLDVGGSRLGPVEAAAAVLESGTRHLVFFVGDENDDWAEMYTRWWIEVTGNGAFDAFAGTSFGAGFLEPPSGVTVDNRSTIGFPADGRNVLAVGSYVTRSEWTAIDGAAHQQIDPMSERPVRRGELSGFSGRGPSRREDWTGLKPDITAPGELVAAPLAARSGRESEAVVVREPDGFHLLQGTSVSSAVMTGIVALVLQARPETTIEELRAVLDETARSPEQFDGHRHDWGRGKVDAHAALARLLNELPLGTDGAAGASPEPEQGPEPPAPLVGASAEGCTCSAQSLRRGDPSGVRLAFVFALIAWQRRRLSTKCA